VKHRSVGRAPRRCLTLAMACALLAAPGAGAAPRGWPTFGYDVQRSGHNRAEQDLGPRQARRLVEVWSAATGAAVNAQPVVADGVQLPDGRVADLAFVGTEAGWLVALDMRSGAVVWRRFLGTATPGGVFGCPAYPKQVFGMTGSPVIEPSRGRIYAAGGDDRAYALDLGTGALLPGWPVQLARPEHEHVWGALTLWRGMLYAGVASYCDRAPYTGAVYAVDTGAASLHATWRVTGAGAHAPDGGGVWGWGGVSVDPSDGDVYAATGNALTARETDGYAEHVVRLSRDLAVKQARYPFRANSVDDQDFGSTPLLYRAKGCIPQLAVVSKNGELLIFRRHAIGRGPVQRIRAARGSSSGDIALLGLPAFDARRRLLYLLSPSEPRQRPGRLGRGLQAYRVTRSCRLRPAWSTPAGVRTLTSAPVVADGVVYFTSGQTSRLHAIDGATGRGLRTIDLHATAAFAAPTPVDGGVLVADGDGTVRLYRPALRALTGGDGPS
jgi:outer membrane protein assembly factor BamB